MTPTGRRWLASTVSTLVALAIAYPVYRSLAPSATRPTIIVEPDASNVEPWLGQMDYVYDPIAGHRPRPGVTVQFDIGGLGEAEPAHTVRHTNNLGLVREDDLVGAITSPRVLILGDSHVHGIVSTQDNVGPLLEQALRATPGLGSATVLNAGCGMYNLYQYVLRARTLLASLDPQAVVVVVFMGNDFVELDNLRSPYLDDDLVERPALEQPPPQRTSARRSRLALPVSGMFWQGLNQALYFHEEPERAAVLRRKAHRAVELMTELCLGSDRELLFMLLPSFDVVFPELAAEASPVARMVVESGAQLALYEDFRTLLVELGVRHVDLLPVFVADGRLDLYASDYHIWKRGHELLAQALAGALADGRLR